jgi:4-amino-4-deoxy-L-arabinose transferase-like glycosyltransferase
MSRSLSRLTLLLILLLAAGLRLTAVDWDGYNHYHPDERYILWVATTIEWPTDWATAFDPAQSTFNPYHWPPGAASAGIVVEQGRPRFFAYGHLPLYLGVSATRVVERLSPLLLRYLPADWLLTRDIFNGAEWIEMRHMTAVSRALTGVVDVVTVLLVYFLGRQLYGRPVGLLAAAFLAFNVMHVQLARFFTVDPYVSMFAVAAVLCLVLYVQARRTGVEAAPVGWRPATLFLLGAAVATGLAIGSKFAAVFLFLPLTLAVWLDQARSLRQRVALFSATVTVALLAFVLTNPFALLDQSCRPVAAPFGRIDPERLPSFVRHSCFLANVSTQGSMVRGDFVPVFARQYIGTLPYLYPVEMQLRWGMGFGLGLLAFAGFAWATALPFHDLRLRLLRLPILRRRAPLEHLLVLAWVVPFFLITAAFQVKFMRYLQPIVPFLMVYAAALLLAWIPERWWRLAAAVALLPPALYTFAFANMYTAPHPWTDASRWLYDQIAPGAVILAERWDDPLPVRLAEHNPDQYDILELNWLVGVGQQDNELKLAQNLILLEEADYVVVASQRSYGVAPRLPGHYPLSGQYHQLLFDGRLGYEMVYVSGRFPNLAGLNHKYDPFGWPGLRPPAAVSHYLENLRGASWGRVDESFVVYDHPLVMIFENRQRLTAAAMADRFDLGN